MMWGIKAVRTPVLVLVLLAAGVLPTSSQTVAQESAPAADVAVSAAAEMTAADLSAWLDGYMPNTIANADVVGVVVTVVRDGHVIANRGYGYSDLESSTPVDPEHTLFRPGSISKLFTWTAVMQQVEAGHLDLDVDVNGYLDFAVPAFNGEPITLRNIMTYTTGFEEVVHDLILATDASTSLTLEDYLKQNLPNRIYPPGTMPAYSNYATALAGYIVQRASGEAFADYVQRHIFEPLHMEHSTFMQPLPEAMRPAMSRGYISRADGEAQPFEIVPASPAGALSTTGPDMALFLNAHLNQGAGILRPETAQMMHETIDRQFPGVNNMALGFYRDDLNGQRVLGHGGDTLFFHSNVALMMDQNVGVFISLNSGGGQTPGARMLRRQFMQAFADRYFPVDRPALPEPIVTAHEHGAAVAGDLFPWAKDRIGAAKRRSGGARFAAGEW